MFSTLTWKTFFIYLKNTDDNKKLTQHPLFKNKKPAFKPECGWL